LWDIRTKNTGEFKKYCHFGNFEESRQQDFKDVKGLVIADYQNYIEQNWIKSLKEKYKPVIHYEVLKKSKK
jgi:peptidyl-prolyl cis-trans isomerase SurA